jgi:hypothetical protein
MGDVFITGHTLPKAELGSCPTGAAQSAHRSNRLGTASQEHSAWAGSHHAERRRLIRIVNLNTFDHDEEAPTDV